MTTPTAYVFSSGTRAQAAQVNSMINVHARQDLINRMNALLMGSPFDTADGFRYNLSYNNSSTSYADTTNSTCLYTEKGLIAFCDVLDLFDSGTVPSASIWTTATTNSVFPVPTISVGSGVLTISGGGSDSVGSAHDATATIISNGASGLNLNGQNTEVLIDMSLACSASGSGSPSASYQLQISDGTTHVALRSVSNTASSTTEDWFWRIVYNDSAKTVNLSKIVNGVETTLATGTSVAAITNKYIRLAFTAHTGGSGSVPAASFTALVRGVGYRKNGAGAGNADFVTSSIAALSVSSQNAVVHGFWLNKPTVTAAASTDGTTSYAASDAYDSWVQTPVAGTSLKIKITGAKPTTITAGQANIPILILWGALYG